MFRWHQQSGGIVRRVDVDGARVRANERFECGEIVGPAVFGFAAPFADSGAGAFGNGQSAFVARRFHDGVILRSQQRVIEEEDGFFGGGDNHELVGMDLLINGGKNFAKPGSAGRFGVAAPMFEKRVMSAGFEGEQFFDGLRFGVGGGEQILGGKFVFAHVLFNAEGSDLHEGECAKAAGWASRTKLIARACPHALKRKRCRNA